MASANPLVEYWTYLAIDIVIVGGRVAARWKTLGLGNLAPDDFLMVVAILLYTAETATAHWVGSFWFGLANNGMTPQQRASLDPASEEFHLRTEGSKTQLFGWLVYIVLLWVLKFSWLFFYRRLGEGVNQMALKINFGFIFCAATFVATFGAVLLKCQPISKNWQIYPDPGNWCQPAVSQIQAYVVISMNLATDFYVMSIPVPMVWSARIPGKRKFALIGMFCGGLLTAIFGILRCTFVLLNRPNGPELAGAWSCRESFVAVFISNLPVMYPIMHRLTKNLSKAYTQSRSRSQSRPGDAAAGGDNKTPGGGGSSFKMSAMSKVSRKKDKYQHPLSLPPETYYTRFGSEEEIMGCDGKMGPVTSMGKDGSFVGTSPFPQVMVTRDFEVRDSFQEPADQDDKSGKSSSLF